MDRKFLITAFSYAIVGIALGIFMAASHNHTQLVTHAHVMLIGFLLSFAYALCHKLWLVNPSQKLMQSQFVIHQVGTIGTVIGLFLLYGNFIALEVIDPILAISSFLVLVAVILMTILIIKSK